MAVKSAEELKSCRPIRALLFRGASKEIRDIKDQLPIDIAQNIQSITLKQEIVGYLNNNGGFFDCCMLKTPLRKVEKSLKMAIYFITLNGSVYIIQGLFLYPVWISRYFIEVDVGLGILTLIFWFVCLMSSPGFIKKPKNIEFLEIMKLIDPV